MNNKNAEWQREYYLTHDKYRMQGQGTACYKVVKGLTRILQLPTIAKLTTDNESVISDFRLNRGEYGLEPYDEYAIHSIAYTNRIQAAPSTQRQNGISNLFLPKHPHWRGA